SSSVAPHVKSGRVRVLAVTMGKRSTLNPEWPTLQQEGVKEVDASNWTALFAPKATPQPVIDKLHAEVVKILHMPDGKERFAGGVGRAREAGGGALLRDRPEGEHPAGLISVRRAGASR